MNEKKIKDIYMKTKEDEEKEREEEIGHVLE